MKIAKALKLKNQLAGDIAQLKDLLAKQNSRSTKQKFDYDNREVLTRLRAKLDELVKVKAAVAAANAEIYDKVFRLAELKGLVTTLTGLDTKAFGAILVRYRDALYPQSATIDLDARQRSLTHYIENRRAWSGRIGRELDVPQHLCPEASGGESESCTAFADAVDTLAEHHGFIVIDTPGHDGALSRLAHSMADTLITPLNATVDPLPFALGPILPEALQVCVLPAE